MLFRSDLWLTNFVKAILKNKKIAGVYGKQEPLEFSDPNDVRDLIYIFGKDKKIQTFKKYCKFIEFKSDLPKTNVGKILRRALRDTEKTA